MPLRRGGYLWVILRDQRCWGGADPPIVVFHHSRTRSGEVAQGILEGFAGGTLMVDGHPVYDVVTDPKKTEHPWTTGRLEMDTNGVENAIRPVPLTRKNALFAGSDDGAKSWARVASLIGTCKLNRVDPEAYIATTLRKILDHHMQRDIDELMPWNFSKWSTQHLIGGGRALTPEAHGPSLTVIPGATRRLAGLDVNQQLAPALRALAHADLKTRQLLPAFGCGAGKGQDTLGLRLHPGLKADAVGSHADIAPGREIPALPAVMLLLPLPGQPRGHAGQTGSVLPSP